MPGRQRAQDARSRRTLYLTPPLVELLRRHRARQAEERLAAGEAWQDHGLVFPSEVGTPLDPGNFSHRFSALCKRAGLGHWHPHELRHSGTRTKSCRPSAWRGGPADAGRRSPAGRGRTAHEGVMAGSTPEHYEQYEHYVRMSRG
ncbi:tyrosine-type recombinase/integrase [Micromonospora purpureochromogenes]|uniref:tyrosine-type recombinase/integrase n=1 Tax=Micromonospora purpureochromogenes TaxID=47872 RepID=UPI003326CCA3